jgi:hypothetical protein
MDEAFPHHLACPSYLQWQALRINPCPSGSLIAGKEAALLIVSFLHRFAAFDNSLMISLKPLALPALKAERNLFAHQEMSLHSG